MSLDAIIGDANRALANLETQLREVKKGSDERQKKLLGDLYDLSAYLLEAVTALGNQVNVGPALDRFRDDVSKTVSGGLQAHRRRRRKRTTTTRKTTRRTSSKGRKRSTTTRKTKSTKSRRHRRRRTHTRR